MGILLGKKSIEENTCPHCGAVNEYSDVAKNVMELSAQHYKKCIKCKGHFVDTYLIDFPDYRDQESWEEERRYDDSNVDQVELFNELMENGHLLYDEDNPNDDSDYYDIQLQSIHFITDED